MFHSSFRPVMKNIWLASCAASLVVISTSAQAAVAHKYTFNNGDVSDSVGGASYNGTLVDNTSIATFTGGTINLTANNGLNSGGTATAGAYVDLPDFLLNSAITGGVYGQASMEIWFTVQDNRNWAEVFNFGDGPDGVSGDGGGRNYVALIPQSGVNPSDFRGTTRDASNSESPLIGSASPLPTNQKQHVVMTFDIFDSTAGANGTTKLYLNNGAPVSAELRPFLDLVQDNNNWLGRSPWGGDPLFDGLIDEFRIYDTALSTSEVNSSFLAGPEPAPFPVLVINRDTGAISVTNQSGSAIQLKGYSISSTAGSFNPATWTSIDAGNVFDPDGTWTAQSSTAFNLAESNTGGPSLNGGTLTTPPSAGSSRGIGTPWLKSPLEDVTFSFTLGDGTTGNGLVQYTGTAISRSDLNGDGSINVADWALFAPNSFTSFAGQSAVAAYRKGDLNGDMVNDYKDFRLFKADYIAVNGLEAFAALGAIPEPSSFVLLTFAASVTLGVRRK
jgi:hypothetical protein